VIDGFGSIRPHGLIVFEAWVIFPTVLNADDSATWLVHELQLDW